MEHNMEIQALDTLYPNMGPDSLTEYGSKAEFS